MSGFTTSLGALQDRLTALCSAGRAFGRAVPDEASVIERELMNLNVALTDLIERPNGSTASQENQENQENREGREGEARIAEASLASGIEQAGRSIRTRLDRIDLADLRAHLSDVVGSERGDLLELLDVVIEDEAGLSARSELVELFVTQLATEVQAGRRRIAHDPATLTSRLRDLSARATGREDFDAVALERELLSAAQRLGSEPLRDILSQTREKKARMGHALVAPVVLRALVYYNAAVWNHIRETTREPAAPVAAAAEGVARPPIMAVPRPVQPSEPSITPTAPAAPVAPVALADGMRWKVSPPTAKPAPRPEPDRVERRRSRWALVKLGAAAALLAVTAWVWVADPTGSIRVLARDELESLSPWLESGYRNDHGAGRFFVGSLKDSWASQPVAKRESTTRQIVAQLADAGVEELILYDSRRRTVTRVESGLPPRGVN